MRKLLTIAAALACMACGSNDVRQATLLLEQAQAAYEAGRYDEAIRDIDSLRTTYPEAISVRQQALRLYQETELRRTQDELARTDSALRVVEQEYEQMKEQGYTREQWISWRKRADSLKVQFDTQCAKIRLIHRRQSE